MKSLVLVLRLVHCSHPTYTTSLFVLSSTTYYEFGVIVHANFRSPKTANYFWSLSSQDFFFSTYCPGEQ
ncbi:uncharacterized protein LACBIDRAFT_303940 [Laccaria bicolor S238N-H82]|uniref:Predicted protein n=1 Tax=Laccaria bicolor (strain S238N-H82 / ATCC MYA-4686) TaxID=486041 RepID=B0E4A2_LACBS|nr:uncharacterized protein LACBIDRAFT_303940 [Laccaria bicolor S238N-H82]EDQ98328.1 predicted protein [Laccaria bicolor S238N-H82]|eukprot:XP_001891021.1 predicted protein [Laccaria bicolor S238N-H82]